MYLKKALWSMGISKQSTSSSSTQPETDPPTTASTTATTTATATDTVTAVSELVNSLSKQGVYREIALRNGFHYARAEFSFLRVRGLRSLLKIRRSVAQSDSTIHLFCLSQFLPDLQVVPVLFEHSFKESVDDRVTSLDHIFSVDPMKIRSPSTDGGVALALRVLEGCCLLHRESTVLAHHHKAVPVVYFLTYQNSVI